MIMDTFGCTPAFIGANEKAVKGLADGYFDAVAMIASEPAKAHEIMGQAAEMSGNFKLADTEFQAAISVLERSRHLTEHLVACLAIYAQVLEARGDALGALELLKRAIGATRPELAPAAAEQEQEEAQSSA